MQVAPSGGHASSATWWSKLKPMQKMKKNEKVQK